MASEDEEDEVYAYSAGELDDEDEEQCTDGKEEDDDVEWENVDSSPLAADALTARPSAAPYPPDPVAVHSDDICPNVPATIDTQPKRAQVDWDHVNRSLADKDAAVAAASVACKRRRPCLRLTRDERKRETALHQTHLLLLLALRIKWTRWSCHKLLQGLLLSLATASDVDFCAEVKQRPCAYSLALLVRWFGHAFELSSEPSKALDTEVVTEAALLSVFFARRGRDVELALLFAALCGALQLRYRVTWALDPLLVQKGKVFESSFRRKVGKRPRRSRTIATTLLNRKRRRSDESDEEKETGDKALDLTSDETVGQVFWLWCEVLDEKTKSWIHVDAVRRLVDRPRDVEPLRGKAFRFSYVISIQDDGLLVDVTARYAVHWSKSLALRLADSWLERVLEQINDDTNSQYDENRAAWIRSRANVAADATAEEKKALETLKLAEGMPTSVEGFRKHHLYCLERHLSRSECLHPRKVVGLFNGQAVFLRKHVQPVRSAFKWRRLGRVVKDEERQKPARWQSRDGSLSGCNGSSDDVCGSDRDGTKDTSSLALYGLWQTTEFGPPPVVDGRVPKTKYGNIEIWSHAHVPRGAVHLQLPRIDALAESLGVDFAPAVVGFEVRKGRTVPKIAGIVVAQSHEAMLLDAHAEKQQQTIEKAIAYNRKLVLRRWAKLTKRLLLRQRLEDDYGAVGH
ncbi:unnamed protein product [Hyaloperonospora brassicae]|uniref:Rad4 beta-hairpin domain-containing protein n=1 Tax=Hyaloperonospora brassicae TaxID=162125 RepID=A0AAV0SZC5_HYABA|nr:unnamed protein product [Hyaloperonospora brassicae]